MIKTQKQNLNNLIEAFRDKNEHEFRFLLKTYAYSSAVSLSSIGIDLSLLEYILSTPKSSNFIKICLTYGGQHHKKNSLGYSLLDYAIKSMCADNLKILVDHLNKLSLNDIIQQMVVNSEIPNNNNLLHNVIQSISTENYEECRTIIQILLNEGCNPNHFDANRSTPFELILDKFKNNQPVSDIIETFLNSSISCIEVSDTEFNRSLVSNQNSDKLIIRRSNADISNLKEFINQGNENEFILMLNQTEMNYQILSNVTELIKKCIEMNFVKGIGKLLQSAIDASKSANSECNIDSFIPTVKMYRINNKPLLFYAIKLCRPRIVKVLLDLNYAQFQNEPQSYSVLHEICSMNNIKSDIDFQQCFKLIIKDHRCDYNLINGYDNTGKTPLMYACENDHKEIIYELLRRGAYIGHESIINNLCEDTFKKFLDECINPTSNISDQNCAVQINFKFLIPPKYSLIRNDETKALKLIASQQRFKSLLTHPVLTSYLELKWKRVNILVYIALILYFIFFVYLSLFILNFFSDERYAGKCNESDISSRNNFPVDSTTTVNPVLLKELKEVNVWKVLFGRKKRDVGSEDSIDLVNSPEQCNLNDYIVSNRFSYKICLIGTLILTVCEIIQFIFNWKTYFFKLSNWVDCILLYLAYVVLLNGFAVNVELFRKLRAVLFIVISIQSFILLSRVSKLSLQLEIFKKVSKTFIKFIMLYFMLIFAFAMAFYTLYGNQNRGNNNVEVKRSDKDDEDGFQSILMSVITVVRMMLSDFDKMKLEPDDNFNSIIFLTFVLLITIILFNLLNALAINDTQHIMKSAEIVDVRKRIAIVGNCERILAFLKVEFFNIYSNLIHNGVIILKINEDNYIRIKNKEKSIKRFESSENDCLDMMPLDYDHHEIFQNKYIKIYTPQLVRCYKLHRRFGNFRLVNPNLSLGKENVMKIINHIKNLMEDEK